MTSPLSNLYLGMLSGTSRDGVDAVLVRFDSDQPELIDTMCVAYPTGLADVLRRMVERGRRPHDDELALADRELAEFFGLAAWSLLDKAGVSPQSLAAIGSHGQTVWHDPSRQNPETIQLGDPQRIASLLGVTTVGNFRQADMQAGGQGAPLAPLLHRALLKPATGVRAVVNIGGIANVSLLQADGDVIGYDTGPGNCLMDGWTQRHHDAAYDESGQWAASGNCHSALLQQLLSDPYFSMRHPKSTGVEYFNIYWLESGLEKFRNIAEPVGPRDIQATLCELTAQTIANEVRQSGASELLVCGGGAQNTDLMTRLSRLLPQMRVGSTLSAGIHPDWMEAILFAWLARERLAGRSQDTTVITGARTPVLLGDVFKPR